jgi:sugar diacid utilization regulator
MPTSFKDVLRMECLAQARIVAGQKGLDNEVRWITVGEEPDLPEWVFGGELICSTLFAVEADRLGDYVKGLSDNGVAGMLIKPKRFLGAIPDSILEVANRESFPVAEVPANVLWSRVLESFYRYLLVEQTERIRIETKMRLRGGFFDELLSDGLSGEEIEHRAALLGCDLSGGAAVLFFEVPDLDELARKRKLGELQVQYLKSLLYETVNGAVREAHQNYICIPRSESVLVLIGSPLEDRTVLARHVLLRCRERIKNLPVHAGLGEPRESPGRLIKSYREAESALQVGQRLRGAEDLADRIHTFSELGVQRLLFALAQESPDVLSGFLDNAIGAAVNYDAGHGTDLVKTLKAYIECNGNVSEAAELLHVHKHTIRYRLRRVTELTGLDATKFEDAAQLYLAVRAIELI